jgi:hypothetical protein
MSNAASWIFTKLTTDATLTALIGTRVYRDQAPEAATFPFVTFTQIDAVPVKNAFADILMDGERWQITAVDNGKSYTKVNSIAARLRNLLHKTSGSNVLSSVLEMEFTRSETDNAGNIYKSVILDFRVHTQ